MVSSTRKSYVWSYVLLLLILAPLLVLFLIFLSDSSRTSPGQDMLDLTKYAKEALAFKRQQMNSLAQLTILLIGALWALLIGAKGRSPRLTGPLWALFSSPNILLGASYLFYLEATNLLTEYLFRAQNIDIYSPRVALLTNYQIMTFSLGLAYSVLFALVFYLRRQEEE